MKSSVAFPESVLPQSGLTTYRHFDVVNAVVFLKYPVFETPYCITKDTNSRNPCAENIELFMLLLCYLFSTLAFRVCDFF